MYRLDIYENTVVIVRLLVMKYKLFKTIFSEAVNGKYLLVLEVFCYSISQETITINEVSIEIYYLTVIVSSTTP